MAPTLAEVAEREGMILEEMVGQVVTLKVEETVTTVTVTEIDLKAGTYVVVPLFGGEPRTFKIGDKELD